MEGSPDGCIPGYISCGEPTTEGIVWLPASKCLCVSDNSPNELSAIVSFLYGYLLLLITMEI